MVVLGAGGRLEPSAVRVVGRSCCSNASSGCSAIERLAAAVVQTFRNEQALRVVAANCTLDRPGTIGEVWWAGHSTRPSARRILKACFGAVPIARGPRSGVERDAARV